MTDYKSLDEIITKELIERCPWRKLDNFSNPICWAIQNNGFCTAPDCAPIHFAGGSPTLKHASVKISGDGLEPKLERPILKRLEEIQAENAIPGATTEEEGLAKLGKEIGELLKKNKGGEEENGSSI